MSFVMKIGRHTRVSWALLGIKNAFNVLECLATLFKSLVFIRMVWAEPFFDNLKFLSTLPPSSCLQSPRLKHHWYFGKWGKIKNKVLAEISSSICLTITQNVSMAILPFSCCCTWILFSLIPQELLILHVALAGLTAPFLELYVQWII